MLEKSWSELPLLSSPQNQRVKDYVALRDDGNMRREKQRFLLEGKRAVATALAASHILVHELIFCEHLLGTTLAAAGTGSNQTGAADARQQGCVQEDSRSSNAARRCRRGAAARLGRRAGVWAARKLSWWRPAACRTPATSAR